MDLDPTLLTVTGTFATVTLTEAVAFVREQVSLILQRRREDAGLINSALLDGPLNTASVDKKELERNRATLVRLWHELGPQPSKAELAEEQKRIRVYEARSRLEKILGQHISFIGEDRPTTGTPIPASPAEGSRVFHISGERNIAIGGDNHGPITIKR